MVMIIALKRLSTPNILKFYFSYFKILAAGTGLEPVYPGVFFSQGFSHVIHPS